MKTVPMTQIKNLHTGNWFSNRKVSKTSLPKLGMETKDGKFIFFVVLEGGLYTIYKQTTITGGIEILDVYAKFVTRKQADRVLVQTIYEYELIRK